MTETNEIEFDGVAQNGEIVEYGISEHVEYAGVHSGDATMTFLPSRFPSLQPVRSRRFHVPSPRSSTSLVLSISSTWLRVVM